jgi:hypothetical protein
MSQGASNGAGQGAGKSFVSFSRPAAQRIAKAVRVIEAGDRNQPGLTFDHPMPGGVAGKVFRVCTFTGAWSINTSKTVTFKYQTATPNTASATNLFFPVTSTAQLDCGIAKDGTAWFLIDVPFCTASAVFVTSFSVVATLNTNTCGIIVSTTAGTATATFLRIGVP